MSMAEVIESIEKDMWQDLESRSVPESQPEMIDCTTLGEEPNYSIFVEEYLVAIHQKCRA